MKMVKAVSFWILLISSFLSSAALWANTQPKVLDISVQRIDGRIAAAITFSAVVKTDVSLDQWLSIESLDGETIEGSWIVGEKAKTLYFTNVEPEHGYLVSVKKGLPFAGWQLLAQGAKERVDFKAIKPMLGFAGNGNLLADTLTDGLPVISVNALNVDVDFYRIPKQHLVAFLTSNRRRGQQDFWEIQSFIERSELVYSARFDLNLAPNQTATSYLPIKDVEELQAQGVYLAIMRRAGEYKYSYPATWFASSDLGIHLRLYQQRTEINVASLATAQGRAGVKLSLFNKSGKEIAATTSDDDGNAAFSQSQIEKARLLIASKGAETSVVRLFGPTLDLSEFPVTGIQSQAQQLFFYSERDLYRPAESVTVSALLRDADGQLMPPQVVTFKLKQPDGRVVSEQRLKPNALGYYATQWQLPKDAARGEWAVNAQIPGQKTTRYAIQVEDFLPERMQLELTNAPIIKTTDELRVEVDGQYLYGAPASGNTLQSELVTLLAEHPFKAFEDYYFSNPLLGEFKNRVELDDKVLNDKGLLTVTPKNSWQKAKTPLQLKLYTSLLDSGGRPVSRIANSYALPAQQLVGIKPLFKDDSAPYDSNASFEIILSDGAKKLAASGLELKLIRERRNYHWLYTDSEGWTSDYTERHFTVFDQKLTLKADQGLQVSVPVEWGHYRLEIYNPETQLVTGYKFRAGWSADETVMAGRPDRIGLALDKQQYAVGDRVSVEIKAPAAGRGFLLVESDQVLHRQSVEVAKEGTTVSFVVQEGWNTHDLYVSVLLIQPGESREEKLPRRMMGVMPLKLDREARKLEVEIQAASEIRPNSELTIPIKVQRDGKVVEGPVQVTVAAVDVGVLNISRFESPDPFEGFFQQRAYQVTSRDSYSDLIMADEGVMAQLKFGGDSDSLTSGEADLDVQIVSLYSGVVDVDETGQVVVSLSVPDFNGRLRLMAVAFSEQSFGSAEQEVQVAAPIVSQLTKARFLRPGDQSNLALDLSNLTAQPQQLQVTLSLTEGLSFENGQAKSKQHKVQVELAKGEKKIQLIPIVADAGPGKSQISLVVDNILLPNQPVEKVTRQWQLSVLPAWGKSERQWQRALASKDEFLLEKGQFDDWLAQGMEAQLSLAARPSFPIASHFSALKAYPYGCLEQTTSGVFPQLYSDDDLLAELGIKGSGAQARSDAIDIAIQRLQSMQRGSGGFGLWSEHSPEEYWLSVYVVDFLMRAQQSGYSVPRDNLNKALKRLAVYLRSPNKISSYDRKTDQRTKFAVRAYAAQVLAQHMNVPLSILRRMYDDMSVDESPLAMLQLGLALQMAGDQVRADEAILDAVSRPLDFGNTANIYYASAVRDLALASYWMIEAKQPADRWLPLLLALTTELNNRQWLSTQERNALFMLGRVLRDVESGVLDFSIELGDQVTQGSEKTQLPISAEQLQQRLMVRNKAEKDLYLNLRASGYAQQQPAALDNQMTVKRRYYPLNGEPFTGNVLTSGDKLLVELTMRSEQRLRHALIVDLLPAGLEIENQNLMDSYDQSDIEIDGEPISEIMYNLSIKYQEYRDDQFVMALDSARKRNQRIYYIVRAVSAGDYKIPPTFAEDMYRPQIRHQGADAGRLKVLPR